VALAVGLIALVTGAAVFLAGLLLPVPPLYANQVPLSAVNRAANVRFDGGRDAPKVTKDPSIRFTAMTQSDINDHFGLRTVNEHIRVSQSGPGIVRSDLKQKADRPRNCAGTNMDSAHLATLPVCQDPQGAFAAMAAHYRGAWTRWDGTGAAAAQAAGAVLAPEAAQAAAETVLLVEPIGSSPEGRSRVYSRIAMRPEAQWEVDLDVGPLTLIVQHGRVGLVLDDGSAHIEVDDLLFGKRSDPVPSGSRIVLWPGDRLVVSHGRHLRVDNDDATLAIISVARLQQSPPSVTIESE
jgi:hypothetical protein